MPSAIETLIFALSQDLEGLQKVASTIDAVSIPAAIETQGQAVALGVNEVVMTLEMVKGEINAAMTHVGEAVKAIESARTVASALPT